MTLRESEQERTKKIHERSDPLVGKWHVMSDYNVPSHLGEKQLSTQLRKTQLSRQLKRWWAPTSK